MKKIYLIIGFIWLCLSLNAQPSEIVKPTANAQQFKIGLSTSVNMQAGQPVVNIPLFVLKGRGIEIPISLSYNSGAVTHETEATSVGLGWSLMAGGVITASIRGISNFRYQKNQIPWQYNSHYIQDAYNSSNLAQPQLTIEKALNDVFVGDGQPDDYNYSFLNYSGDICFKHDDSGKLISKLYPDEDFKLEKNNKGIKITDCNANNYYFEGIETNVFDGRRDTTAWYLTKIITNLGDSVNFIYKSESYYDMQSEFDGRFRKMFNSKRIERIEFSGGYVDFKTADRHDVYYNDNQTTPQRITNIELYDKSGILVKGYELDNNSSEFTNQNNDNNNTTYYFEDQSECYRMKLSKITEYTQNNNMLPSYEFSYDYYFARSKSSYKDRNSYYYTLNSWAAPIGPVALLDRDSYGTPRCFFISPNTPEENIVGFSTIYDYYDITTSDFLSLTKIKYPTGGSETFEYELHDYRRISDSEKFISSSTVSGKRLKKRIVSDGNGKKQIFEYKYRLHDNFYNVTSVSSGILVTIPIHTSTVYKPYSSPSNPDFARLIATPYQTPKPQNSMPGQPVYYTEVEEISVSENGEILGKNINYYERVFSIPAMNYMFTNYIEQGDPPGKSRWMSLTPIENHIFGTQGNYPSNLSAYNNYNFTYMAYPVGNFYLLDAMLGKIKKKVVLNKFSGIVSKTENKYGLTLSSELYGIVVERFNDNTTEHPEFNAYRYLFSVTKKQFSNVYLQQTIETNYSTTTSDSIFTKQEFNYTSGGRLISSTITGSSGEVISKEITYPDYVYFSTQTNLSPQSMIVKKMIDKNMTAIPLQTTERKNEIFTNGSLTTYKVINGDIIVPDSIFSLEKQSLTNINPLSVNSDGKLIRNSHFLPEMSILTYDNKSNPTSVCGKDGLLNSFVWDIKGQNILAKIENLSQTQLQSNTNLVNLINTLNNYSSITDANLSSLVSCNQSIRTNLPAQSSITTYTYKPLVGVTSITDPRGVMARYEYDNFGRYMMARNNEGNILERYNYSYQNGMDNEQGMPVMEVEIICPFNDYYMINAIGQTEVSRVSGGSGDYTYSWYLRNKYGTELISNLQTTSTHFSFTCSEQGVLTVECIVTDNVTGQRVTGTKTITVYTYPTAAVSTGAGWYMLNGFGSASATAASGSANYSYAWKLKNSGETVLQTETNSATFNYICSQSGPLTVECTVTDNVTNQTATDSKSVMCYTMPTASINIGATSYNLNDTGSASVSVIGGSSNYSYAWSLLSGSSVLTNGTNSSSFSFNCSQSGTLTVKCIVTDNVTGRTNTVTQNISCTPGVIYDNFSVESIYINYYNSLSKTGSNVSFILAFGLTSTSMYPGNDYLVASVPAAFRPTSTRTITYDSYGMIWNITITPAGWVYCKIVYGPTLSVGEGVSLFGSYNI